MGLQDDLHAGEAVQAHGSQLHLHLLPASPTCTWGDFVFYFWQHIVGAKVRTNYDQKVVT